MAFWASSSQGHRSVASGSCAYSSANPVSGCDGSSRTLAMGRVDLGDGLVGDVEGLVDDGEAFSQLAFVDTQGRVRHDRVPADESVEPVLAEGLPDRLHRLRRPVEGSERLHRLAVLDKLHDAEEADCAR